MLTNDTITFGKYKGNNISRVLRDRKYCEWLVNQEWFKENYEFLYNMVEKYKPKTYFFSSITTSDNFIKDYVFFNLISLTELEIELSECDKSCYEYYLKIIKNLRERILTRLENEDENPYDIKAPVNWLKAFEKEYIISREDFKDFLQAYELPNIPYIIEDIKKEGGIEYKGAKSFKIAKARSKAQEEWWEIMLKDKYNEKISMQFKYEKCIFDMININTKTIFECKLGLKDFDDTQYIKYKKALKDYRIVYLVDYDSVVVMEKETIYCLEPDKYIKYLVSLTKKTKKTKFDEILINFNIEKIDNISSMFGLT
jgi:hypothetical protein|tara:strand:+ start:1121 stop:2059 length:939 start_codon:yes stop_codon:yes gene_type:complete